MAFTDTGGELFRLLRVLESGDRTRLTGENYGLRNGNALGAYQMGASSLIQIGAVRAGGDVNRPADWTGRYGSSAEEFLATKALQDRACLAYMNTLDARLDDAYNAYFGTRQNGAVVNRSGALLCSWENPEETRLAITGRPYSHDPRTGLADYVTRMQFGALVEGTPAPVAAPEPVEGAPSTGEGGDSGPDDPPLPLGL
ncbi:MAG: hypothetical protein JO264_06730 [Acidisphaera sp.]|nr:hypothetical protein [Acidisphaera sp.]